MCGVEWFSQHQLQRKTIIFEMQNAILNENLFRAGHVNQLQEVRFRDCNRQIQELSRAKNLLDQKVSSLQKELETQRTSLESEKRAHLSTAQALNNEFKCHADTENDRDRERAMVGKMTEILNNISFNKGDLSVAWLDEVGLGTILHEWENMKHERTNLQEKGSCQTKELQNNQQIPGHQLENTEVKSGSACSYGSEDVEIKTAVILPPVEARQGKRRKRE